MRISDWSSGVCSSDLTAAERIELLAFAIALDPDLEPAVDDDVNIARQVAFFDHAFSRRMLFEFRHQREHARLPQAQAGQQRNRMLRRFAEIEPQHRSEERRVGNAWFSKCRSRWCAVI